MFALTHNQQNNNEGYCMLRNESHKYRRDIDGLRTLAVIPVVLFHLDVGSFSGGYMGVDIFFVISGYLITSIIAKDANEGRFDLQNFYERRIRRIFPAISVVTLASSIVAYKMLLPTELRDFGQSVVASTLFSSNVLFWLESGYFSGAAEGKPLLHTWSLAVEEQFYLVFPLLLVALIKVLPNTFRIILGVILLLSFSINLYLTKYYPDAAFYLIVGRFWELLLGSLLALGCAIDLSQRGLREQASCLGLALILAGVFLLDRATPFPGIAALLPCIGTVLIINAGIFGETVVSRLLSMRVMTWVGMLSYSLYLWHWPLIVYTKQYLARPLSSYESLILFVTMIIISFLSWKYIEAPFRDKSIFSKRRQIFVGAASVIFISVSFGIAANITHGFPGRVPEKASLISNAIDDYIEFLPFSCFLSSIESFNGKLCVIGQDKVEKMEFILWGDSHARSLIPGIAGAAEENGFSGFFAGHEGCPPLLDVIKSTARKRVDSNSCSVFNDNVIDIIRSKDEVKNVILFARWVIGVEGVRLATAPHHTPYVFLYDDQTDLIAEKNNLLAFKRGIARTIEALINAGKTVTIVGPLPEIPANTSPAIALSAMLGIERDFRPREDLVLARISQTLSVLEEMRVRYGVNILLPHQVLCKEAVCQVEANDIPLFHDDDHLSIHGAIYVSKQLA